MSTLILGASLNPSRYSYKATERLLEAGEEVVLIGRKEGELFGKRIHTGKPQFKDIETVTLYLGQRNQEEYLNYLVKEIVPKRIIFNPGAENATLARMATDEGIEVLHACTLVMLATNQY